MIRTTLAAVAAVLFATGAAAAPKHAVHKPPAKAATPHAAPRAPAAALLADTADPATMAVVLQGAGAKTQAARKEPDGVLVTVSSTLADFSIQYAQCDP